MNIFKNITLEITNKNDVHWPHYKYEPRVSRKLASVGPTVLHTFLWLIQHIPVAIRNLSPGKTRVKPARQDGLETKSKLRREKLHRTNQGSSFSNRDNVVNPDQFRKER